MKTGPRSIVCGRPDEFYCAVIRRGAKEVVPTRFTRPMTSACRPAHVQPGNFREFFKPRYEKLIRTAHDCNMHFGCTPAVMCACSGRLCRIGST